MGMIIADAITKRIDRGPWVIGGVSTTVWHPPGVGQSRIGAKNIPTGYWVDITCFDYGPFNSGVLGVNEIAYGNGYWVAGATTNASGTPFPLLAWCTDPINSGIWTLVSTPLDSEATGGVRAVEYGNGYWVASGSTTISGGPRLITTTDPTVGWVQNVSVTNLIDKVSYGNGYWAGVIAGTGSIIYTTNPTTAWTTKATGLTEIYKIAYGNGYWVGVGRTGPSTAGIAYATTLGGSWTTVNLPPVYAYISVVYGNGYWVIGGYSGSMLYATNPAGIWNSALSPFETVSGRIIDITYGNGYYVAIGKNLSTYNNIATTTDVTGSWGFATGGASGNSDRFACVETDN